jgi:hypothetical protein
MRAHNSRACWIVREIKARGGGKVARRTTPRHSESVHACAAWAPELREENKQQRVGRASEAVHVQRAKLVQDETEHGGLKVKIVSLGNF